MAAKERMSRQVAIFDVDGTIFRSSLLIELVEALVREEVFPPEARDSYQRAYTRWLDREGEYADYIHSVVKAFGKHLKGAYYGDVRDIATRVVQEKSKRTYRYTRDLVRKLKRKKYYLLAISHSPKMALDEFCTSLGFDKVYGTIYEIGPASRFTGAISDIHIIANKANVVRRAVEKEKLTLTDSIGVGDTESDMSFLEMVDLPVCFNPNQKLYRHAKRMKWSVIVERKDVIYEIQ